MVRGLVCAALLAFPTTVLGESRVATPTFSVAGGDYASLVIVIVRVSTPGATIHFTQNGLDPTRSDPVIVSGSRIAINTSLTLKARAWKPGLEPSEVRAATYRMVALSVGPPIGNGDAAAGGAQSVLAMPDGRVFAWNREAAPLPVDGLSGITKVAAGTGHALAITQDGQVYGWGANGSGQLGDGTHTRRPRPVRIAGLENIVQVVAARTHSLALSSDGRVFAFGGNSRGQLGIDSLNFAAVPTLVPSLSNVVAVDAGDSHSVAVTNSGELFAWGANELGQLGDGSRTDRSTPVRVAIAALSGVAAGGDHTLALARDGAVYSWGLGTRGQLGTGSTTLTLRPTAIGGLLAFAVAAGRNFSAAVRRDGVLVTWGANDSGQLGDGTRIDRVAPVAGPDLPGLSTLALGDQHAIAVTSAGDVWTWGREGSASATFTGLEDWGPPIGTPAELQPPTLHPPSGAYASPQLVTVTAADDDHLLRYTLDGSEPTSESSVYTEPLVVSVATTVSARAFSSVEGVEPSAIVSHAYTIDMSPPSIVAEVSPPLTSLWMTTPVTVSFRCEDDSGRVSCPEPVTVTSEGGAQLISGTAVDPAGNQVTVSVTVNVDLTPPTVILDGLPDHGVTTEARITLRGRVTDAGSGLADFMRCNGGAVTVIQESFECLVDLQPGKNSVTLQAGDVAGHVTAAGVEVMRIGTASRLAIAPDFRALVTNEVAVMSLRDDFGAAVAQAMWISSDNGVVALSSDDPPLITALAPGTATITAEKDGLVAAATIAVHAGLELPPGTTRWTIEQTPGYAMKEPIYTSRVNAAVPDLFIVEATGSGEAMLRAATSDGEVLWRQHAPGVPLMGDVAGGVVVGVPYEIGWLTEFRAYVRIGGAGGGQPWRYDSAGRLVRPAQAPDGTLHAIEHVLGHDINGKQIWDKHIVSLDGKTGRVLHRFRIPRETRTFTAAADGTVISTTPRIVCTSTRSEEVPRTAGPVIGSDGRAYFLVRRRTYQAWGFCLDGGPSPARDIEQGIDLVITAGNAAPAIRSLYEQRCQAEANIPPVTVCDGPFSVGELMPDGIGGLLATWTRTAEVVSFNVRVEPVLTRWDANDVRIDRAGLDAFQPDFVGQRGVAYRGAHSTYDVVTGKQIWARSSNQLIPMAATPDAGVAMLDPGARQLHHTDSTGTIVSSHPFTLDSSAVHEFGQWIGRMGSTLTSLSGKFSDATRWRFGGNRQGQFRSRMPGVGVFAKSHTVVAPLNFQHVSIRITPTFQKFWRDLRPSDFVHLDEYDNYFMTIGAGTAEGDASVSCSGTLTKGINRDRDVATDPTNLERLPLHSLDELRVINDLYVHFAGYKDDLPYACLPEINPGKYNSNSFASGLLRRVGAPLPLFPLRGTAVPGWATPVPPSKFEP